MQYRTLGATGVRVSPLVLGAMNFGAIGNTDHDESIAIIHAALDAGINLIDTADSYSLGESETIVGEALAGRRDDVVVATKATNPMGDGPNQRGSSRRWLTTSVDNSLRRLGTDRIDLFQVHRPDWDTSDEETLSALTDLQRAGKILSFGSSTFPAHRIVEAQWAARTHSLSRYVTEQPAYSILMRGIERDVLPVTERFGMGVLTWSPLASGWLTGAITGDGATSARAKSLPMLFDQSIPENRQKLHIVQQLAGVAEQAGLTMVQLALAFATTHPAVTAAIIGPRTMGQLRSQVAALDVVLTPDVLDAIDRISPPGVDVAPNDRFEIPEPAFAQAARRRR
jgi:aryl-alcohol dehydrogenase-like predicted oxidoreductase